MILSKLSAIVVVILTVGCAAIGRSTRVHLNMTQLEVSSRMGVPQRRLDIPPGEVWLYRGGRTALIFDDERKLRWLTTGQPISDEELSTVEERFKIIYDRCCGRKK